MLFAIRTWAAALKRRLAAEHGSYSALSEGISNSLALALRIYFFLIFQCKNVNKKQYIFT